MPATARKKARQRIALEPADLLSKFREPSIQRKFQSAMKRWAKRTEPMIEAVRSAERLDEKDFVIRINTRA